MFEQKLSELKAKFPSQAFRLEMLSKHLHDVDPETCIEILNAIGSMLDCAELKKRQRELRETSPTDPTVSGTPTSDTTHKSCHETLLRKIEELSEIVGFEIEDTEEDFMFALEKATQTFTREGMYKVAFLLSEILTLKIMHEHKHD